MRPALCVGIVTALLSGTALCQETTPAATPKPPPKPLYWDAVGLDQRVSLPVLRDTRPQLFLQPPAPKDQPGVSVPVRAVQIAVLPAQEFAKEVRKQTKAKVYFSAEFGYQLLTLPGKPGAVREVMRDLEAHFPLARWWQQRDAWVLARSPAEAVLMLLTPEQRTQAALKANEELLKSIPEPLWAELMKRDGVPMTIRQMPFQVQRAVMTMVRLDASDPESTSWGSFAMSGDLYLTFKGSGQGAMLGVYEGGHGKGGGYGVSIPFFNPMNGRPMYGVRPPR